MQTQGPSSQQQQPPSSTLIPPLQQNNSHPSTSGLQSPHLRGNSPVSSIESGLHSQGTLLPPIGVTHQQQSQQQHQHQQQQQQQQQHLPSQAHPHHSHLNQHHQQQQHHHMSGGHASSPGETSSTPPPSLLPPAPVPPAASSIPVLPTTQETDDIKLPPHLVNGTILKTALTNPSEIVHLRHRLDSAVSSSKDRQINYDHALSMIQTLIDCDAMEDIATLPHFSEFLEDKSEISEKLCNIGDSIVHKLVSWTKKLPFYLEIPVEIHTKLLTDKWHEILILTTAAYQALHGKRHMVSSKTRTMVSSSGSGSGSGSGGSCSMSSNSSNASSASSSSSSPTQHNSHATSTSPSAAHHHHQHHHHHQQQQQQHHHQQQEHHHHLHQLQQQQQPISGHNSLPPMVHKDDPEFVSEVSAHLSTLQTCLTTLMGQPIAMEQLKLDVGHMVDKMTQITIMFRRIKLKMEEYVCLKVYILLNKGIYKYTFVI